MYIYVIYVHVYMTEFFIFTKRLSHTPSRTLTTNAHALTYYFIYFQYPYIRQFVVPLRVHIYVSSEMKYEETLS